MEANETWTKIADNVAIPYHPSGITLEYPDANSSITIKQADVVLNTYPLNYVNNYTDDQSLNDLNYVRNSGSPDSITI